MKSEGKRGKGEGKAARLHRQDATGVREGRTPRLGNCGKKRQKKNRQKDSFNGRERKKKKGKKSSKSKLIHRSPRGRNEVHILSHRGEKKGEIK